MRLEPGRTQPRSGRGERAQAHATGPSACRVTHGASISGVATASIAPMKKLLLLVVIAALATLATKKVRAA